MQRRWRSASCGPRTGLSDLSIAAHEILHAQYFLQKGFSAVADKFWDEKVTADDKDSARQILAPYYDVEDPILLRNEFQAYILMAGGTSSVLRGMVSTYREPFVAALAAEDLAPLEIE